MRGIALESGCMLLQVACSRCGALHEVGLATEAAAACQLEQAGTCSTCSQAWSVGMRPLLVHAHSSCLARIRTEGCAPRDLLPSMYAAQCGSCSSIASFRHAQQLLYACNPHWQLWKSLRHLGTMLELQWTCKTQTFCVLYNASLQRHLAMGPYVLSLAPGE